MARLAKTALSSCAAVIFGGLIMLGIAQTMAAD